MDYVGRENLEILEETAPFYNQYLVRVFTKIFKRFGLESNSEVLDFGAGIGTLALAFQAAGIQNIHCLEIDPNQLTILRSRNLTAYKEMNELNKKYKYVYMSNVLEHIEEDYSSLREIANLALSKDGVLVIYVPAFMILFSDADVQVGHFRRYTRRSLEDVVQGAGLQVRESYYIDSLGFIALWLLKYVFRRDMKLESNRNLIRIYDGLIFPLSKLADKLGLKHMFGKNVLLVATKI